MITLKDVSTYSLVKEINNEEIKQLFRTYEINNYQSLYHALIRKLVPDTDQILYSLAKAEKLVASSKKINVPKLLHFHNNSIDYEVNGIDAGITSTVCNALNMKNLIYLYTHVDLNGKLCMLNYPGIKGKNMKNIRESILHYDKVMFPELLMQKRKIKKRC